MFDKRYLAYVLEADLLAGVKSFDFVKKELTLTDGEGSVYCFSISEVEILPELFDIDELVVFDRDVFQRGEFLYEIEEQEDGEVVFHALNENLERNFSGAKMPISESLIEELKNGFELIGNFYELMVEEDEFDFNSKIVKDYNGDFYTYFYACNDKDRQEIDLICVSFVGNVNVEGYLHNRKTISYSEFSEELKSGRLKEVSHDEFANFVLGVLGQQGELVEDKDTEECCKECCEDCCETDEPAVEVEDTRVSGVTVPVCKDCKKYEHNCECSPW